MRMFPRIAPLVRRASPSLSSIRTRNARTMSTPALAPLPLAAALDSMQPAWGAWLTLPSSAVARTLASTPGLSWVCIDAEHGLINDSHFYDLVGAVSAAGCSPLIRVPIDQDWWLKRALDAGAHGVLTPMAHDAETARRVVAAAKYPPVGIRGFGPMFTHGAGALGAAYAATANARTRVLVQIESRAGVEAVDEIAAVDGLDALFIGPFDLAMSLGVKPGDEAHEAAIARVLAACQRAGKPAAIFCLDGADAARRRAQGFSMISIATDIDTLSTGIRAHAAAALGSGSEEAGGAGGYGY